MNGLISVLLFWAVTAIALALFMALVWIFPSAVGYVLAALLLFQSISVSVDVYEENKK